MVREQERMADCEEHVGRQVWLALPTTSTAAAAQCERQDRRPWTPRGRLAATQAAPVPSPRHQYGDRDSGLAEIYVSELSCHTYR
jgi:hypothetical protein